MEHINNEEIPSTPATPGAKKSLLNNCKCFGIQEWNLEDGALPTVTCSLMPPPPPVLLAKKVYIQLSLIYIDR